MLCPAELYALDERRNVSDSNRRAACRNHGLASRHLGPLGQHSSNLVAQAGADPATNAL